MRTRGLAASAIALALSIVPCAGSQVFQTSKVSQDKDTVEIVTSPTYSICTRGSNLAKLEGGMLEMFSSGALQASSQLVRLCIGEPGRMRIPLYFFVGVPGKTSGSNASNDATFASLVNPLGGYFNVNAADAFKLWPRGKSTIKYTSIQFMYQAGLKYLNGRDSASGTGVATAALNALGGLRFQTAAIDLDDTDSTNVGFFFVQLSAQDNTATEANAFRRMFGNRMGNSMGNLVLDAGLEISKRIKVRAAAMRSFQKLGTLDRMTYRFAFDYLPSDASASPEKLKGKK